MRLDPLRLSAAWPIFSLIAAGAVLAGYVFGMPVYRRHVLRTDLERAVRMYAIGYVPHIALADFTDFDWTEVHIYPPYTAIETIENEIGRAWPALASRSIESNDAISLLVFTNGGRLVRWVEIGRSIADYSDVADGSPYTPETGVFIMPVGGQPDMVVLTLSP